MNRYSTAPRGPILCLGPGRDAALDQAAQARAAGCPALAVAPGLSLAEGIDGTLAPETARHAAGDHRRGLLGRRDDRARTPGQALAAREGAIVPLLMSAAWLAPFA
jgi:RHH-type proline utilization regulon transcriptional repressor/proline dehydrogenase/delta 1-pyrroline-5-carboxylate dehydrogenase